MFDETLALTKALIERRSLTPDDQGCQKLIADRLTKVGFNATHLRFVDVDNLWITHGTDKPLFVFAGHTDVVPTGPLDQWYFDPFTPTIKDGYLYGRGAADMKASLAAMVIAAEQFVQQYPDHSGTLAFLITSDEEGPSEHGTKKVMEYLTENNIHIDYCIVGEPSSEKNLGDQIRHGRRGSLSGNLTIQGKQGHIAYPNSAKNPIHTAMAALLELTQTTWDAGFDSFPPTSFQISNIHAGTGANNVIPGELNLLFNFRYSPAVTYEELQAKTEAILKKHGLTFSVNWRLSGKPFITTPGKLTDICQEAIFEKTNLSSTLSTSGGTSDGRFIAPTGANVVELGPCNATIHKINECIRVDDLIPLADIYFNICKKLLNSSTKA